MLESVRRASADEDVVFLAVSIDPDVPNIVTTSKRLGVEMEQLVANGEVMGPLRVGHMPSTVFIDRRGRLVAAAQGPHPEGFYRRRIRAITSE